MRCRQCGEEFEPRTVIQKYCSERRGKRYRSEHGKEINDEYPRIVFQCAKCNKRVITEGNTRDKRTRFCSAECERKYWKHPPAEGKSPLTEFRSMKEYEAYERRSNL